MTKREPSRPSSKSTRAPSTYCRLMASTTRATPSVTICVSSSATWSSKANPYEKPEQPPPVTYRRSLSLGLPSSTINSATLAAAEGVNSSWPGMTPGRVGLSMVGAASILNSFFGDAVGKWWGDSMRAGAADRLLGELFGGTCGMARTEVGHGRLDRVLGQDRTMDFYRWQGQLFGNVGVLDGQGLVQRATAHPFRDQRARRDGRATAVGLELGVFDHALCVDADLQSHHVATGGCTHHAGADVVVAGLEGANVAGVLVVVNDLVTVCHGILRICVDG